MSQMSPEEALRRSHEAGRLMSDKMLTETLDFMEKEVTDAWLACPVRDVEGRETLWRLAVTTRKFRDILKGTMESGKLAADEISRKKSFAERAKAAVQDYRFRRA